MRLVEEFFVVSQILLVFQQGVCEQGSVGRRPSRTAYGPIDGEVGGATARVEGASPECPVTS